MDEIKKDKISPSEFVRLSALLAIADTSLLQPSPVRIDWWHQVRS